MKKLLFFLCMGFLIVSADALAQQEEIETRPQHGGEMKAVDPEIRTDANEFINKAISGGKMEVELGNMALTRAASETVKEFAQKIIDDHSRVNQELMSILNKNNAHTSVKGEIMEEHQGHINSMSSRSGADFDRAYIQLMVEDHQEDIKAFEDASKNHPDEEIRNWAERTLPVLQQHYNLANQLNKIMGNSQQQWQ